MAYRPLIWWWYHSIWPFILYKQTIKRFDTGKALVMELDIHKYKSCYLWSNQFRTSYLYKLLHDFKIKKKVRVYFSLFDYSGFWNLKNVANGRKVALEKNSWHENKNTYILTVWQRIKIMKSKFCTSRISFSRIIIAFS